MPRLAPVDSLVSTLGTPDRQPVRCERLRPVPWLPWLFSGPALERIYDRAAADARAAAPVPYFAGVTSGETEALCAAFANVRLIERARND